MNNYDIFSWGWLYLSCGIFPSNRVFSGFLLIGLAFLAFSPFRQKTGVKKRSVRRGGFGLLSGNFGGFLQFAPVFLYRTVNNAQKKAGRAAAPPVVQISDIQGTICII